MKSFVLLPIQSQADFSCPEGRAASTPAFDTNSTIYCCTCYVGASAEEQ
jgi:hypothetical protein